MHGILVRNYEQTPDLSGESRYFFATGAALGGEAVILFERYEQKDKSETPDQPEAGNAQMITIVK